MTAMTGTRVARLRGIIVWMGKTLYLLRHAKSSWEDEVVGPLVHGGNAARS